jgi:hypothetical protein
MINRLFSNFRIFKKEINKVFRDIDVMYTAKRTLRNLRQTSRANYYATNF